MLLLSKLCIYHSLRILKSYIFKRVSAPLCLLEEASTEAFAPLDYISVFIFWNVLWFRLRGHPWWDVLVFFPSGVKVKEVAYKANIPVKMSLRTCVWTSEKERVRDGENLLLAFTLVVICWEMFFKLLHLSGPLPFYL